MRSRLIKAYPLISFMEWRTIQNFYLIFRILQPRILFFHLITVYLSCQWPSILPHLWLMVKMGQLNRELGTGTVQLGLPRQNNAWTLRSEQRTPRYTTCWKELTRVKA